MKYYLSFAVICCMAISLFGESLSPKFSNGGFEKKMWKGHPAGWGAHAVMKDKSRKLPKLIYDKTEFKEGERSLKVESTGSERAIILDARLGKVVPGKVYEVSFWCRVNGKCRVWVRENHISVNGKWNGKLFRKFAEINGPAAWKKYSAKIKTASTDGSLGITVFIDRGKGTVWLDDFKINEYKIETGTEVSFRLTPNYYTENNVFHLPQNAPLMLYLTCANMVQHKFENPRVVIELPSQVKLLSCGYDSREYKPARRIKKDGVEYLRYEYTMGVPKTVMRRPDFSGTAWNSVIPMIYTSAPPSKKLYPCFISYKDDKITCKPSEFNIRITDKISQETAPKKFSIGIHAGTGVEYYGAPLKRFMQFYKACGFNSIYLPDVLRAGSITPEGKMRNPAPIYSEASRLGVETFMSSNCLGNGYLLRYVRASYKAPASTKLKRANGMVVKEAFDPAYIIRKGEWYAKGINQVVDRAVKLKTKGIWVNWEPHMYVGANGSFTELSLKDFARFAGLSEAKVLKMQPGQIVKQYREKLFEFQSFQFAMAMKSMMELIKKRSAELKYPLEIDLCTGSIFFRPLQSLKRSSFIRYRKNFMTEQWGKYFDTLSSWWYVYFKSDDYCDKNLKKLIDLGYRIPECKTLAPVSHAATLEEVEKTVAFIKKQAKKDNRKPQRYIHLTQNIQCSNWVVTPREFGIQILAAFVGGADGVDIYYFPGGYDGQYWRQAALVNSKMAMFEDYVLSGQRVEEVEAEPLAELFKSKDADFSKRFQVRAFRKDGKLLVALCNFDYISQAPAILKLKMPAGKYTLSAPWLKNTYVYRGKEWLDSNDLMNLPVIVEPMTVQFLVLNKSQETPGFKKVYLNDIQGKCQSLVPELNRKFRERQKESGRVIRLIQQVEKGELKSAANFKPLIGKGIKTALVKKSGQWMLELELSRNKISIAPESGATVTSWTVGDKQLVCRNNKLAKLCYDRFYMPKGYASGLDKKVYEIKSQKIINNNLELVLAMSIPNGNLRGLYLEKRFLFNNNGTTFNLEYRLVNRGEKPMTVGFWVWNCFEMSKLASKPQLTVGNAKAAGLDMDKTIFYENKKIPFLNGMLRTITHQTIKSGTAILSNSSGGITLETPIEKLAGFLCWSILDEHYTTLETIFSPVVLTKSSSTKINLKYQYKSR
jgi:hypothetical protein